MTRKKLFSRMLLLLVCLGCATTSAFACTCVAAPLEQRFRKANAVFAGQAADDSQLPQKTTSIQGDGEQILSVLKAWKGVTREFVAIRFQELHDSAANCPTLFYFEQGKQYLVFAYGKKLEVQTVCSDTWEIPGEPTSFGYKQMREYTDKLDSFWFRLRSRLRLP